VNSGLFAKESHINQRPDRIQCGIPAAPSNFQSAAFADQLAVGHVEKIFTIQKIDEIHPLFDIRAHIGLVTAIGRYAYGNGLIDPAPDDAEGENREPLLKQTGVWRSDKAGGQKPNRGVNFSGLPAAPTTF
jgi:hypothetical protein